MQKEIKNSNRKSVKPIPDGFHSVTPYIVVDGAQRLIDFVGKAFGGKTTSRMNTDDGKVMHATVQIGDSLIMIADVMENFPAVNSMLYLYVDDVDAVYKQALKAKGSSVREPVDEFYGDRSAGIKDEFGNQWWIATHTEDVDREEMERRKEEFRKQAVES